MSDECTHRGRMPGGCGGRWCNARHVPLSAGPCDPNCEYRTVPRGG
jgi:hypothetical protein